MPQPLSSLLIHLIFSTKDRYPFLGQKDSRRGLSVVTPSGWSDLVRVAIRRERLGAALTIHHGHVAVGPHEINSIALQTAPAHIPSPTKNVQRQSSLLTYCPKLGPGVAIDMYLPVQRCQRLEVVLLELPGTRLNPWQASPATQPSGA